MYFTDKNKIVKIKISPNTKKNNDNNNNTK